MALAPVISDLFSWDPFRGFTTEASANTPPIDWKETPAAHVFAADLPGLSKEEVRVEVEDGRVLKISGERPRRDGKDEGEGGTAWHCAERGGGGPFSRRFRLPEGADVEGMRARMEDGVLTVTVPKKKERAARGKPAVRKVEITSGGKEGKKGRGVKGVLCCSSAV